MILRKVLSVGTVTPVPEKPTSVNWLTHTWAGLALVMLVAVIWYTHSNRRLGGEVAGLNHRLAQVQTANAELIAHNRCLRDALALISLPEARQLVFGTAGREAASGRIWVHPRRGVVLLACGLAAAPAGKIYAMWIVPKRAATTPAGLFNSDARGEAMHVWAKPVDVISSAAIAVTLEAEGGGPAPTSKPVISASL